MIDTPALLNLVKHCRDADIKHGARGSVMGVLKESSVENEGPQLLITQTMPELVGAKLQMQELTEAIENESQKLLDTTKVGFYLSVNMGLTFNLETLTQLYKCYREFKNSVFLIYDVSKSDYGLNPLHCFRLSEKAIEAFTDKTVAAGATSSDKINLVQDRIRSEGLTIAELFEEVPVRIYRSHLVQAFLFDHIQPHMPAFNPNLFKLATPQYLCNHVYQLNEATDELVGEQQRLESVLKNTVKLHKKQSRHQKESKDTTGLEESQGNKIDLFLLSRQVDELCN